MNYEIVPWGPAPDLSRLCPKCDVPMHDDDDRRSGIAAYACFKCGNRVYPDYPKRQANQNVVCKDTENQAA